MKLVNKQFINILIGIFIMISVSAIVVILISKGKPDYANNIIGSYEENVDDLILGRGNANFISFTEDNRFISYQGYEVISSGTYTKINKNIFLENKELAKRSYYEISLNDGSVIEVFIYQDILYFPSSSKTFTYLKTNIHPIELVRVYDSEDDVNKTCFEERVDDRKLTYGYYCQEYDATTYSASPLARAQ
ncbi:MAG: hypothetical protein ACK5G7_00790 [Erysipelotrichaceae bacterium]